MIYEDLIPFERTHICLT